MCDYIFMAQLTDTYFQRGLLGALLVTSPSQDTRTPASVPLTLGIYTQSNENVSGLRGETGVPAKPQQS